MDWVCRDLELKVKIDVEKDVVKIKVECLRYSWRVLSYSASFKARHSNTNQSKK